MPTVKNRMPMTESRTPDAESPTPRSWRRKFGDAFKGIKHGIRGHSSFFVHFFFAAVVIATALALQCTIHDWAVLLFCIGLVLTAELFNSAIETLFHGQDERVKARNYRALDIGAGAVLVASLTAAVVGAAVFLHRLAVLLDWSWSDLGW